MFSFHAHRTPLVAGTGHDLLLLSSHLGTPTAGHALSRICHSYRGKEKRAGKTHWHTFIYISTDQSKSHARASASGSGGGAFLQERAQVTGWQAGTCCMGWGTMIDSGTPSVWKGEGAQGAAVVSLAWVDQEFSGSRGAGVLIPCLSWLPSHPC